MLACVYVCMHVRSIFYSGEGTLSRKNYFYIRFKDRRSITNNNISLCIPIYIPLMYFTGSIIILYRLTVNIKTRGKLATNQNQILKVIHVI